MAENFFGDPRVKKAKNDILLALGEYQKSFTGVKPPSGDLKPDYNKVLDEFGKMRGGNLFIPYVASGLGHGALVELADGSVKYDFITGIGVHIMGHSHHKVVDACLTAALEDTVMQGNLQPNLESVECVRTLLKAVNLKGAGFDHCFLASSGVMAGENALKIAFQKKTPASRILAFKNCFMGRTLVMSQATDKPAYREGLPKTIDVDYVPFFDPANPQGSTEAAVAQLKEHLKNHPGQYAAMCFELVLGEGGFYPGDSHFFKSLIEILKQNNVAVLVDEVQTFCRLPEMFAFQYFGLDKLVDVVWVGKASQVCATFFRENFKPKPGLLSQTYTASSTAITAGHAIVNHLMTGGFYGPEGQIEKIHTYFRGKLEALAQKHPSLIKGPFGIGAMIGFTPLDGSADKVKKFLFALFHNGVMGFTAGDNPTRFRFLVPIGCVTNSDIDAVVEILEKTLVAEGNS